MKETILVTMFVILSACSSSDDSNKPNDNNSNFLIELTGKATNVIDETIAVDIKGNENIMTLQASLDDFQTTLLDRTITPLGFGSSTTLYFSFDNVGEKTIYIKAINNKGDETLKSFTTNVTRGGAVKINSVKVISFSNINGTWDSEFSNNDVNRLADLLFNLQKPEVGITENTFGFQNWFKSEIKENQGDLTWDVSSENLYLDPQFSLRFSMGDDDGGGIAQDIMLGPPFEREITFQEHIGSKPNTITLKVDDIDLEVQFALEWPN
ncbi:hypothetical protein [Flavivirga algicola]|uniref:Lipoprotein n=1 Tax=Flavivirga algicola TaxID=2729136 RepID=A0ABX1S237_9FLAO|nr:hypothetical protein [Flavivirga algicola]NMH89891.1 hypothetical protein [Flavivirga algicola]